MQLKMVSVEIPVQMWQEDDQIVVFSPALDLSSCGNDQEETMRNFEEAVELFFETAEGRHVMHDLLESLGWKAINNSWHPASRALPDERHLSIQVDHPPLFATL